MPAGLGHQKKDGMGIGGCQRNASNVTIKEMGKTDQYEATKML